jgi:hypothetical protein
MENSVSSGGIRCADCSAGADFAGVPTDRMLPRAAVPTREQPNDRPESATSEADFEKSLADHKPKRMLELRRILALIWDLTAVSIIAVRAGRLSRTPEFSTSQP